MQVAHDDGEKPDHSYPTYSARVRRSIIPQSEEITSRLIWMLTLVLLAGSAVAQTPAGTSNSRPKITKEQAMATALAKVPGGRIKESELEREHGKLVWSLKGIGEGGGVREKNGQAQALKRLSALCRVAIPGVELRQLSGATWRPSE